MKTSYRLNGYELYIPDEWEFQYRNGVATYTEYYSDDTPDEAFHNLVEIAKLIAPNIDIKVSGKSVSITFEVPREQTISAVVGEFLMQMYVTYGEEKFMEFINDYIPFLRSMEKGD